jgi:thymidylate kinase
VRVAAGRGVAAKQLTRAAEAEAEDPSAWERAREPAAAAGLETALARLRAAVAAGSPIPPRRTRRLRRRGHLVAVSGLDGAGKTGQAWSLLDALEQTGHAAKVVHVPLGSERVLWVVGGLAHRAVSWAARHGVLEGAAERTQAGASILGDPAHPAPQGGVLRGGLTHVWATFVAVANTTTLWRSASRHILAGRIVIHDRYTLDSIVRLQTLYGEGRRLRFQCWIVRRLSPRPLYSFFLDVAPETAIERKQDRWTVEQLRLQAELYRRHSDDVGASRIDGERPREEICAEIAKKVWRRVGAS